jgi:hypothetical protein
VKALNQNRTFDFTKLGGPDAEGFAIATLDVPMKYMSVHKLVGAMQRRLRGVQRQTAACSAFTRRMRQLSTPWAVQTRRKASCFTAVAFTPENHHV